MAAAMAALVCGCVITCGFAIRITGTATWPAFCRRRWASIFGAYFCSTALLAVMPVTRNTARMIPHQDVGIQ